MNGHMERIIQSKLNGNGIYISIPEQKLYWVKDFSVEQIYPVSTSKNPPSCIENSFGTPWGKHVIAEKIGDGEALGTVFQSRISTRRTYAVYPPQAGLITSRILWLRGLEKGLNKGKNEAGLSCDTHGRYIYIHGTNKEGQIGIPFSQGCINMKNQDVLALFEKVSVGDTVFIDRADMGS